MSILDLPLENQKAIAASLGVPFAQWRSKVEIDLAAAKAYPKPKGRTASPSVRSQMIQRRIDSETPSQPVVTRFF